MANKKMTMVEKFTAVKAMLRGESVENFTVAQAEEFLAERIAQTLKKNASGGGERKLTPKEQEKVDADNALRVVITEVLASAENPMTLGELAKAHTSLAISNQKLTSLIYPMLTERKGVPNPNGTIVRTEVKGKAHFALATPSAE